MEMDALSLGIYATPMALIWMLYAFRRQRAHRQTVEVRNESIEAGLTEPPSLHPLIDTLRCIGCGSCIAACPEMPAHQVLGLVRRKADLISPTDCIGHGACQRACPEGAISLVFGTERRGVDIPNVKPNFETNVAGIFIAGELGGMGLIRNAIEQGRQAVESIAKDLASGTRGKPSSDAVDILVVGAGPAGFAASLSAREKGLNVRTIEQDSLGGTVAHFPRGKVVMTAPARLPMVGLVRFKETSKERLLKFWQDVERKTGVEICYGERLLSIEKDGPYFAIETTTGMVRSRSILLAVGRRGTPRKLGVVGEELPKVMYRLIDPAQYANQRVLVVGGGDSALEAAVCLSEESGTDVTLSYRSEAFTRAKRKNRALLEAASAAGRVRILMSSNVKAIRPDSVVIDQDGKEICLLNDTVIINAGGILPTQFLKDIGIAVETKYGTA